MAALGALTQAQTAAEAALPLGSEKIGDTRMGAKPVAEQGQEVGWNDEPGAPKEPPPDNVMTSEAGEPMGIDGPDGPEWVVGD
jgi:hypothetical protein